MALTVDHDPTSYANFKDCEVNHAHFVWSVDFDKEIIAGSVTLKVSIKSTKATELKLDTRDLKILTVLLIHDDVTPLKFALEKPTFEPFGSQLTIQLPLQKTFGSNIQIKIEYETTSQCSALQWLKKEQTSGKQHPYLFSQCQAIHARSLFPCQDSPAVKLTYDAEVTVKSPLVALMSAVRDEKVVEQKPGFKTYKFSQKVPIPSYLLAIAVGALESKRLGPRSHVWAEKELVEKAAYEFEETENMLKTAEQIVGPYVWGTYDILVLPPSFPFGGMENPCLTFVTPTILAGDRSLASVIAHEIAHSWTGNLVTNATFEHFWLNEGHTTFIERKICGRLFKAEAYRHFMAFNGWKSLEYSVQRFGVDHPYTKLITHLENVDPDDVFSTIPYEKGHTLLFYLESKLGGNEQFEKFLRFLIERFKYKSFLTAEWKAALYEFFSDKKAILDTVDWDSWFNKPGLPPVKPQWIRLGIKAQWEPIIKLALNFVTIQGRLKFTTPVYKDLYAWEKARPLAIENFKATRQYMHSTTAGLVAKELHL